MFNTINNCVYRMAALEHLAPQKNNTLQSTCCRLRFSKMDVVRSIDEEQVDVLDLILKLTVGALSGCAHGNR